MEIDSMKKFFVNPAEIINRAKKSVEFDESRRASGKGCNCVNCRSCDNSCNK